LILYENPAYDSTQGVNPTAAIVVFMLFALLILYLIWRVRKSLREERKLQDEDNGRLD
jgi:membrane protein implicated in regulation of membrane protease activity